MRNLVLASIFALLTSPVSASPDALRAALAAISAENFEEAANATAAIADQPAADVVIWSRLRARRGTFAEYIAFLERNSDWPGLPLLRSRGEGNIPQDADPAQVIAYFEPQPPGSGIGSLRLAAALSQSGRQAEAEAEIIRAWTTLLLLNAEQEEFLTNYSRLLSDYNIARLDNLLWENQETRARQMFAFVPEGWQQLAEARIALRAQRSNVNALIDLVPADLRSDPGLNYERFIWRMREGIWDTSGDLILATSTSAETLGRPAVWARRRSELARDVMRDGNFGRAYQIAANHFIAPEVDYEAYSDLEWIAGYAALQDGDAESALTHFTNFRTTVFSPISLGRAGYWLGRANEALNNMPAAAQAYALGAQYQSSFYGQLAAERAGLGPDPAFLANEDYGDFRQAAFLQSSVLRAALALHEAGEDELAERFLTHLSETLPRHEIGQLTELALEIGSPHIALLIAKRAAQQGHEIMRAYYPVTELAEADLPAPAALILSIARRESEFDPSVISGAGAMGLMQLMPRTGQAMAEQLGLPYDQARLLSDPSYNAILGAGYLAYLTEEFGNNPVLLSVAYNAGPSRARSWIERFGDPRGGNIDIVDWIESVPFEETRNYIMRVTESLPIYEAQLTGSLPDLPLTQRLTQP